MLKQSTPSVFIAMLVASLLHMVAAVDPATTVGGGEPVLELYMHDILGGSNPTARPAGRVSPSERRGSDSQRNGALPTVSINGVPLGTGLAGTILPETLITSPGDLRGELCDGSTQMMAFTVMMEGGEYGDSLNFFGVYKIGSVMSKLSLTGGTANIRTLVGSQRFDRSSLQAACHGRRGDLVEDHRPFEILKLCGDMRNKCVFACVKMNVFLVCSFLCRCDYECWNICYVFA
ncbi:hypothetical protein C3L33_17461, partial [Rhododendron williamsianum]